MERRDERVKDGSETVLLIREGSMDRMDVEG